MTNEIVKSEINIALFAKSIAQGDDYQQSTLINVLAVEMKVCCKDKDLTGLQPCNIADKLDKNGIDLIKSLAEFIKLREDCNIKKIPV